jgi:glycosidase
VGKRAILLAFGIAAAGLTLSARADAPAVPIVTTVAYVNGKMNLAVWYKTGVYGDRNGANLSYAYEIGMKGAGKDENKRVPMYWSDDPKDPDMCAGPPDMDEMSMKFAPAKAQREDGLSLWTWFREVIRVRNAFPAIARGRTEGADSISDDNVAAFFRRYAESGADGGSSAAGASEGDLLIVMNLRADTAVKEISGEASAAGGADGSADNNLTLAAVLNTGEENITYDDGVLTLPGYSIAVFTMD